MTAAASIPRRPDEFSKGIWVSLGIHVAIFAFFILRAIFVAVEPVDIQSAIRVDIADRLPDKVEPSRLPPKLDPEKPEAKSPPVEEAKPAPPEPSLPQAKPVVPEKTKPVPPVKAPDAINLDKTKDKQKEALAKLKTLAALDKIREETKNEAEKKRLEALAAASKVQAGAAKVRGQRVAPGASLSGIEKLQFEQYWSTLDHHIKQYWQLPEWLANKNLKTIVLVRFDSTGRLLERRVVQGSGQRDHDDSAIETVDKANPFPAPPDKFVDKVSIEGILVKFGE